MHQLLSFFYIDGGEETLGIKKIEYHFYVQPRIDRHFSYVRSSQLNDPSFFNWNWTDIG
ncbi:MAG: hypothetical protein Ct9H90mP4_11070 [Gammaproteobacteria bacterium]|nr:MAG: hypothetical protein Ct9H90mP4_11070 [Gammaproteobacteria bacterium]